MITFKGHAGQVYSAAFNPTGDRILTASQDGTAKLWDLSGRCLATLQGHSRAVLSAAFSPTDDRIVTASRDGTAKLWDLHGNCLSTLQGHRGNWVNSIAFNPVDANVDANVVIALENIAHLWDLRNGTLLATLEGHTNRVNSVAFSPPLDTDFLGQDLAQAQQTATSEDSARPLLADVLPPCALSSATPMPQLEVGLVSSMEPPSVCEKPHRHHHENLAPPSPVTHDVEEDRELPDAVRSCEERCVEEDERYEEREATCCTCFGVAPWNALRCRFCRKKSH